MIKFTPKGIIPAMVTPIDATGRINESVPVSVKAPFITIFPPSRQFS